MPRRDDDEKLRICGACVSFPTFSLLHRPLLTYQQPHSYCVFSRRGWHGSQTPCSLLQSSAIVTRYLSGMDVEKKQLELQYGEKNIKCLVEAFEEDRLNREYLEGNSMGCPGCEVRIEKSAGCNRALCWLWLFAPP